jgi:hypothetical protein
MMTGVVHHRMILVSLRFKKFPIVFGLRKALMHVDL